MDPSSPSPSTQKEIVDEVYGFIKVYSDGTVERPHFPGGYLPACPDFVKGLASKDVNIDPDRGLWARLFLPQSVASSTRKCPVVLHFHGGGLCSGTPAATSFHRFCSKMAVKSQSIWVSVDHRLAPEHRLPAAYDDAHAAFMWLCAQSHMQASHAPGQVPHAESLHTHDGHEKADGAHTKHDAKVHVTDKHYCVDSSLKYGADVDRWHTHGVHLDGLQTHGAHEEAVKHASRGCHMNGHLENSYSHEKAAIRSSHGHDTNGHFTDAHICTNSSCGGSNNSICKHTPEPWLHNHADFSKCFLAGESSGGSIVHYLAMRIVNYKDSLLQVQGLLMIHAALLIEGVYDGSHNPRVERRPDTYRWLCLPVGAAGDHPLVNPLHVHAPSINGIILPPSIVAVADQDKFCAPGKYYVHAMKQCGHVVELHTTEGQGHCFYLYRPRSKEAESLFKHLVAFMHQRCKFQSRQSSL